jgi:hypothetical protein
VGWSALGHPKREDGASKMTLGIRRAQAKLLISRDRLGVLVRLTQNPNLSPEKRRNARALAQSQLAAVILREKALRHAWQIRVL